MPRKGWVRTTVAAGTKVWIAGWLVVIAAWGVVGRTGDVALAPGPVVAVSSVVHVSGARHTPMTFVSAEVVARPLSPLGWVLASLDPSVSVVPEVGALRAGDLGPLGPAHQTEVEALVAACRVADVRVSEVGGELVREVVASSPLRGFVRSGDLVVAIDGVPVPTQAAFESAVAAAVLHPRVAVTVVRPLGGGLDELRSTIEVPSESGQLGLVTSPAEAVTTPLSVRLDLPDIETSSAGLAIALSILDELRPALLARAPRVRVAALAGIGPNGQLEPVSSLRQRLLAARVAGVQVAIVAASQAQQARVDAAGRLRLLVAASLRRAVRMLDGVRVVAALPRAH